MPSHLKHKRGATPV